MSKIHDEANSRALRALPPCPGFAGGQLGPHVGTGIPGQGGSRISDVTPTPQRGARRHAVPTGGRVNKGGATVTSAREIAYIRARERGELEIANPERRAKAAVRPESVREQMERIMRAYLSGDATVRTDAMREILRAYWHATGRISPI